MTQRLFIAILPPPDITDLLIDQMADLPGVNWQGEDQLHLTLRFLGDVNLPTSEELIEELATVDFQPIMIEIEGGDAFRRKGRPISIHRLVKRSEPLMRLSQSIDRRCEAAGLGRRERRFLPHITLARLNASSPDMESYIASLDRLSGPSFIADRFTLVRSHLSRHGAFYEPIVDFVAV